MTTLARFTATTPPYQRAIWAKCFQRSKSTVAFTAEDVEQSVPARFEQIVRMFSQRVAVKLGNQAITYAELSAMANRLARLLCAQCGDSTEPVALLLEKDVPLMAAMLAVLKTGRFFVLLDPSLPKARTAAMLEHSQVESMVTDRHNISLAREMVSNHCQLIEIESSDSATSAGNLHLPVAPGDLAYLIYTSGSTGQPKGVIQNHRNLMHRIFLRANASHVGEEDRIALLPNGTSNAVTNIFLALLNGATLFPFDVKKEGVTHLAAWLSAERISLCMISSTLFRSLCDSLTEGQQFPDVREIRLRSEAAYRTDVDLYKKCFPPQCVLVNGLSSSETGPLTEYLIGHTTEIIGNEVPLGYPFPDKEILLLDDAGNQIGSNEIGEIAVRSRYLSPGYWHRPDLTEARFKPDCNGGDKRLYLTGDLGLMLPDGCLVYKGRKDFRVKVRGYGVDMVEVEKTLRTHAAIKDAVVVTRQDDLGETNLVAYFTPARSPGPKVGELRSFLQQKLADYMIPSVFVMLDQLPLTSNGKVDRRALPEPKPPRPELDTPVIEPRTFMEEKVAKIWGEVLGLEQSGVHDNFFDLGGHSLLGARLIALLQQDLQMDLPLRLLFESPTIAQLAARIQSRKGPASRSQPTYSYLFQLQSGKNERPVFFFPGGGGGEPEFFIYAKLARYVGPEYPFYGLEVRGADGISEPHRRVEEMAAAYIKEIQALQPHGPYRLVGECAGGVTAYEAARQLRAAGEKIALLALMDVERPSIRNYLRFRVSAFFDPVGVWWRQSYYVVRARFHLEQMRSLQWRDRISYFFNKARNIFLSASHSDERGDFRERRAEEVLEANQAALEHVLWVRENYRLNVRRYTPKPYDGKIHLLINEEWHRHSPALGWDQLALGGIETHKLLGNHDTYIRDHVQVTARELRECLIEAESELKEQSFNP